MDVTDNATCADLGSLTAVGRGRAIGTDATIRAMQIVVKVGIDITCMAIWRDRQQLLNEAKNTDLKKWLSEYRPPAAVPRLP